MVLHFVFWFIGYAAALLVEVFVLPSFLGSSVPAVASAVLILGIAFQEFMPGFWLAAASGVMRDLVRPAGVVPHAAVFLVVFLAMRAVMRSRRWDEPVRRASAVAAGLVSLPLALVGSNWAGAAFFDIRWGWLGWTDLVSRPAAGELLFALAWFSVFSWLMLRWVARKRGEMVGQI
ncbi:MAG: hypothetical protein HY473_02375 [Candidatus Sungbacteria bacterium]|uniref:Uncharacterized protein n=1 Tax=Candidatus Sungiibacteriota bacterium TaxID=2750080 RepID=A0A932YWT0_9BACT|nr:hypothetical protein [Candidatus Sungbacteria bacterium]